MQDERDLYRVQWPTLRRHLYRLCLERHGSVLLDALCASGTPMCDLQTAIDSWLQSVLGELARCARPTAAWPGWAALIPLFGDSERLYRVLAQQADAISQADARGKTNVLWNVLKEYFTACRDALDGARPTRLQVWRRIDRIRHELQRQRQRQGLGECYDLAEMVAHVLSVIEQHALKDAPTTVEGVVSYFYEFDPTYTEPYNEELHGMEAVEALTRSDWQHDLERCLVVLPEDLRQAVEACFALRPQPVLRTDAEFQRHYGCSPRTMRDRAARALQRLREAMSL